MELIDRGLHVVGIQACRGGQIVLASSAGYKPIIVPEDIELDVWGVVRSSVHFHL